jgi:hypothetical protein
MPLANWEKMGKTPAELQAEGVSVETEPKARSMEEIKGIGEERIAKASEMGMGALKRTGEFFSRLAKKGGEYLKTGATLAAAAPEMIQSGYQSAKEAGGRAWDSFNEAGSNLAESMERRRTGMVDSMNETTANVAESFGNWKDRKKGEVVTLVRETGEVASAMGTATKEGLKESWDQTADLASNAYNGIKTFGSEAIARAKQESSRISNAGRERLQEFMARYYEKRAANHQEEAARFARKAALVRGFANLQSA